MYPGLYLTLTNATYKVDQHSSLEKSPYISPLLSLVSYHVSLDINKKNLQLNV